jgi:hypothetical protein
MTNVQELFNDYMKTLDETLSSETDLFKYEEQFARHHREFGRKLLEQRLSKEDENKEYKKNSVPVLELSKQQMCNNAMRKPEMDLR